MATVTAVIPAYNPGQYLARSLGSVLAQVDVDLDVIVVDDGSSQDLSHVPGLSDPRVRYVRTENRGVSAARNLAVALTDAEYVAFLDQDDEWVATDKLARQVELHRTMPDAAFVHTGFIWVLPAGDSDASDPGTVTYERNLAGLGYVCLSSLMVRRERYVTVGGHDLFLAQQQDWDLVLKLLRVYGPADAVPGPLVKYHVHDQNASRNYRRAESESDLVYRRHLSRATAAVVHEGRRRADRLYASKGLDAAREALRAGQTHAVLRHLAAAAAIAPTSLPRAAWASASRRLVGERPFGHASDAQTSA